MCCLYCGKDIGAFRLLRDSEFCSTAHRKKYGDRLARSLHEIAAPEPPPAGIAGFRDGMPLKGGVTTLALLGFQPTGGKEIRVRKDWLLQLDLSDPEITAEAPPGITIPANGDAIPANGDATVRERSLSDANGDATVMERSLSDAVQPTPPAVAGFLRAYPAEPVSAFVQWCADARRIAAPTPRLQFAATLRPALEAVSVRHYPALSTGPAAVPQAEAVTSYVQVSAQASALPPAAPALRLRLAAAPSVDTGAHTPALVRTWAMLPPAEPVTSWVHTSAAAMEVSAQHEFKLPAFTADAEPAPIFDRERAIPAACETFVACASAEPAAAYITVSAQLTAPEIALRLPQMPAAIVYTLPAVDTPAALASHPFIAAGHALPEAVPVFAPARVAMSPLAPAAMLPSLPLGNAPAALAGPAAVPASVPAPLGLSMELSRDAQESTVRHLPVLRVTAELEPLPTPDELMEPPAMCEAFLPAPAAEPVFSYIASSFAPAIAAAVSTILPRAIEMQAPPHVPRSRQSHAAPFAEAVMAEVAPMVSNAPLVLVSRQEIMLPGLPEQAAAELFDTPAAASAGALAEAAEALVTTGYAALPISMAHTARASVALGRQPELFAAAPVLGKFVRGPQPAPLESFLLASSAAPRPMAENVKLLPMDIAASRERILPSFHAQQLAPLVSQPPAAQPRRENPEPLPTVLLMPPAAAPAHLDTGLPKYGLQPVEFHSARLRSEAAGRPDWINSRIPLLPPRFAIRAALDKLEDPALQPRTKAREPQILNMPVKRRPTVLMVAGRVAAAFLLASCLWYGLTNIHGDRSAGTEDLASSGPALANTPGSPAARARTTVAAAPAAPPTGAFGRVKQAIAERASLKVAENFQTTQSWESFQKTQPAGWQRHPDGYMRTGALALFSPTLKFKDYRMEFFGQIESKSIGWTVRSSDTNNYHAMKLSVVEAGTRPFVALVQYNVVDGRPGRKTQTPLNIMVHNNKPLQFAIDVKGNRFVTSIDGEEVDTYTDTTLTAGGVGFFSEAGERARLYWLRVARNDDWLGHVCAMLADTVSTAELKPPSRPATPFHDLPEGNDGVMWGAVWFALPYLRAARKQARRKPGSSDSRFLNEWSEPWNS